MVPFVEIQVLILELILELFQKVFGLALPEAVFLDGSVPGGWERPTGALGRRLTVRACKMPCCCCSRLRMRSSGVASKV